MRTWFILAAILVACIRPDMEAPAPFVPKFGASELAQDGQARVVENVQRNVLKNFGQDVSRVQVRVWWAEQILHWRGKSYLGLCFECTEIYVKVKPDICQSALIHELIHCYHNVVEGHRDPDHQDTKWWELAQDLENKCLNLEL